MLNKKSGIKKLLMTIGLLCVIPASQADMLITEYKESKKSEAKTVFFKDQLSAMHEGFAYANAALEEKGQERLFCPPRKLVINSQNLVSILDKRIAFFEQVMSDKGGVDPKMTVGPILLSGLKHNFPCK